VHSEREETPFALKLFCVKVKKACGGEQGTLTEGEGSRHLTSLCKLVCISSFLMLNVDFYTPILQNKLP
jgi:hypothetical protein